MATPKVLGIETEYGIVRRGTADSNPVTASSLLITAYVSDLERSNLGGPKVNWDFEDETPGVDARDASLGSSQISPETHLVNAVLTNGARFYVDHAHPEISTPECRDARSIVVWDRAAEEIMKRAMVAANSVLGGDQEIVVHKNNSDGKGNAYGCHENYLMARDTPFSSIVASAPAHLITRQIFTGSGKVGSEALGVSNSQVPYQITQRADFFEAEVGLETTLKRPIINTRDEPHADPKQYRRLHVITGDANLSEVATFLKVGTTAFVLSLIEDDAIGRVISFQNPVRAMRQVSYDLSLAKALPLSDGTSATALEIQWELLECSKLWAQREGFEAVGGDEVGKSILVEWESVLEDLESDRTKAADRVDWIAKERLLRAYQDRHGLSWTDPKIAALALQYHDMRPQRCLASRVGLRRITSDDEVQRAMTEPPEDTRAWFRGACLKKWPRDVVAANWDSIVFDVGSPRLRRVPMMEPLRGTRAHVGTLVDKSADPGELINRLSAKVEDATDG